MKKITLLLTFIICAYSWQGYAQATCASPVVVTVEADCSTATPYTIDYSTAADLGTSDLSCDTFGTNTGAWLEFTAPASGAVKVSFTDTNEYALFDSCGGTEIVCVNSATNSGQFLSLTPGATYKLAVWKDSASSGTTDVCLEAITCLPPTALNVSVTSATETSISWTAGNSTPETEWEYVVQDAGTGAPAGAGTLTTNNPVALTGLTQNNDYEFYVRAKCGTSDFSDWSGPMQWLQALPPANDDCSGAIALTVNTDLNCTTVTAGTTRASTASSQANDVSGTPNTDVWFSFVATGTDHTVVISDVVNQGGGTSTSTDMGMGVYDATGGCASLALVQSSDPNTLSLTGLTASTTYYIRAYGWSSSVQYNNFNICVGTPPPPPSPPANDECAGVIALTVNADLSCGTVTAGTTAGATASAETDDVSGTPNTDVWYSFVATDTAHRVEISNVVNQGGGTSTSTDMGMGVYDATGGCMSLTLVDDSDPNTLNLTGLTASTTYYVRVYGWSTSVQYNNFDICVGTPPAPPANDNCVDASGINTLPFNNTGDATSAANNGAFVDPAGCGSMNDGVWYTFTTIDAGTVDIVLGTTGWDSELAIYSGSCGTFTCVARADSSGSGGTETLTGVAVDANTQYWINIGHFSGSTDSPEGPYTIDVSTTDTTTTLGVDDNTLQGFSLFPTLVKEELRFTSQNAVDQITVFSLLGQKVFSSSPNVANSQVNLASLRAGIYLVKVKVGSATATYKIIKE